MNNQEKVKRLNKLIEKSQELKVEDHDDSDFKIWKYLCDRTLIQVFGEYSKEHNHFRNIDFNYAGYMSSYGDYTDEHLRCFRDGFKMLIASIEHYRDELEEITDKKVVVVESKLEAKSTNKINKVFISHASKDAEVVEAVIDMLEDIGVESNQIFCTSFEGYGIDLGENFLDTIKVELSSDTLVLFILSESFYKSPICMCEMGAVWALSKEHIPVLVPPLTYSDIKGVIPLTQGLILTDSLKLNSFKEKIEKVFAIENKLSFSTWERKRDRACARIVKAVS
jgi:hypothetical protein